MNSTHHERGYRTERETLSPVRATGDGFLRVLTAVPTRLAFPGFPPGLAGVDGPAEFACVPQGTDARP